MFNCYLQKKIKNMQYRLIIYEHSILGIVFVQYLSSYRRMQLSYHYADYCSRNNVSVVIIRNIAAIAVNENQVVGDGVLDVPLRLLAQLILAA